MRPAAVVGLVLIILGVIALAFGGFSFTREEKVLDIGPIEATAEEKERVPLPPILGGLAILSGVILIATSGRRRV